MSVDDPTPTLGQNVTFVVTATNHGPSLAGGIEVADVLPPGLAYSAHVATGTTYTPATGIWSIGSLAPAASVVLELTATASRVESIFNQATVTAAMGADPDPSNNSAVVGLNAAAYADVQLHMSVDDQTPASGQTVVLTLTATNASGQPASGVQVMDPLPAGLSYVSDDAAGGYTPGTGSWAIGTLAGGATATLNITALVNTGASVSNLAAKTAQVEVDPNTGNDWASVTLNPVSTTADLSLGKLASQEPVASGESFAYVIVVTNLGPNAATAVTVVDDLIPVGVSLDWTMPAGACTGTTLVTCALGTIPGGGSAAITLGVTKTTGGSIANVASVSATESDPNLANNSNGDTTTPVRLLGFSIQ
jgi:uncharacterized repeat protein (TIGR01451 family)